MTNTPNFDAYYAAAAADSNYHAHLVRVYGEKAAGTMRYATNKHTDAELVAAGEAKVAADKAHLATMAVRS